MEEKLLVKYQKNFTDEFANAFTELRYKQAESKIENYSYNAEPLKVLALDIFHESTRNTVREDTNRVLDIIETWSLDIEQCEWKEKVITFCKSQTDICKVLIGKKADAQELIIVMEDSTNDNVLDYNEFGFAIMKETKTLSDFMILDIETSKGIEYMYNNISILYKRG